MKESRRNYRVQNLDMESVNFVLSLIADRLDELEGRRGTPTFKTAVNMDGNRITSAGLAVNASDAIVKSQADYDTTSLQGQITTHVNRVDNPHTVTHSQLSDKGTNTHAQIDSHLTSVSNPHSTTLDLARQAGSQISGTVEWIDTNSTVLHQMGGGG